jgi:hypothetical protein
MVIVASSIAVPVKPFLEENEKRTSGREAAFRTPILWNTELIALEHCDTAEWQEMNCCESTDHWCYSNPQYARV